MLRSILLLICILVCLPASALDVNGQLKNAQLEKLTANPSTNQVAGRIIYDTDDFIFRYYNGTSWLSVADLSMKLSGFSATTSAELAGVISDETGSGALVFGTAPTITLANGTGLPVSTGISGLGSGVATALATPSSANIASAVTDETGSGALVFGTAPTITLANGTGLPISTGVSGLGSGVATALATPSSANIAGAVTDETGSGLLVFGTSPTITLGNGTGLPLTTGVTGQLPIGNGGTGQATKAAAFDALSPMSGSGDLIYGGASGTGTRLAAGGATQILHGGTPPTWASVTLSSDTNGILPTANGGTNQNSTATFPSSGVVVTEAASETLTNKTISGSDNTISNVAIGSAVSGLGSNVATFLATPSSSNLAAAVTDETGSGALMFGTAPTVTTDLLLTNQAEIRFRETTANGDTFYEGFKAPADLSGNKIWILPTGDGGANQVLATDGSGTLQWASAATSSLTSAHLFVGNGSNVATDTAITGDVTIGNTGVTAIGSSKVTSAMIVDGTIVDGDINASAAIAGSKLVAAASSVAGAVSTGTQTMTGAKTFETSVATPTLSVTTALQQTVTDNSTTGTINNLAWTSGVVRFTGATAITLSGLACPGGSTCASTTNDGLTFTLINTGGAIITLKHDGSGSTAGNRFVVPGTNDLSIPGLGTAMFVYDNSRWRLTGHPPSDYLYSSAAAVANTDITSPTGTITFGTTSFNLITVWRHGSNALIRWDIAWSGGSPGAGTGGNYSFHLPSGLTVDTSLVQVRTAAGGVGTGTCGTMTDTDGSAEGWFSAQAATSSTIQFRNPVTLGSFNTGSTVNFGSTSGSLGLQCEIPITEWRY